MKLSAAGSAGISGIHVAAVDRNGLAGDEIALGGGQKDKRAEQVLRGFIPLERAGGDRSLAGGVHMAGIFSKHRVAERKSGRERIHADAVLAELARQRPRERRDAALAGD